MENYIELKKDSLPNNGQTVYLKGNGISGEKVIKAQFFNENGNLSFKWIRNDFENGICTLTDPKYWRPI
tara:strand:- start:2451 stop:2657 length:207 start_codon:yes stop_codon:yes gene_type:complete